MASANQKIRPPPPQQPEKCLYDKCGATVSSTWFSERLQAWSTMCRGGSKHRLCHKSRAWHKYKNTKDLGQRIPASTESSRPSNALPRPMGTSTASTDKSSDQSTQAMKYRGMAAAMHVQNNNLVQQVSATKAALFVARHEKRESVASKASAEKALDKTRNGPAL